MHSSLRFLSVLVAFGVVVVPASATETVESAVPVSPVVTAAPVTAPDAAAAPAAPAAQAAKPAEGTAAQSATGQDGAVTRVPAGYKSKVVGNETLFCRKDTPLGSRFPKEVCMTAEQYEVSVRQNDSLRQELTGKQKSYSNSP